MTVHVSIDGSNQSSGSIAAFSGSEIRGLETTSSTAPFGDYAGQSMYSLMVHGDSGGDILSFKWSPDGTETNAIPINTSDGSAINFTVNDNLGTVTTPILFVGTTGNYQSGGSGYQSSSSGYQSGTPLTDSNFQTAIEMWFTNEANATTTYGHIRDWNVSGVTNMYQAFQDRTSFNEDISKWDVSKVTNMERIFDQATSFNQNIGDWNVSSVTNMHDMFKNAFSFNQPIGGWDTSSVTRMSYLFSNSGFNHSISDWNVSSVESLTGMFEGNTALSDANKGLIHASFSSNSNWPYDWSTIGTNTSPSELNYSVPLIITENRPVGTLVGQFTATDPDSNSSLAYSLVDGNGSTHNSFFTFDANGTLRTATTFDYESNASTYSIRVQARDDYNATVEKDFTVSLTDLNEAPTLLNGHISLSLSIPEGSEAVTIPATWDRTFGGSGYEEVKEAIATPDGGYLFVGTSDSNATGDKSQTSRGGKDFWAVKVDVSGNKIWDKRFGGSGEDLCHSVVPTSEGGYLLVGSSDSPADGDKSEESRGQEDMWIVKIDQNGTKLWDKRYGGNVEDSCSHAIALQDGGFLLTGGSRSFAGLDKTESRHGGNSDVWVVRIDESGAKLWDKRYGGTGLEYCSGAISTAGSDYVLFCTRSGPTDRDMTEPGHGYQDYLLLKIDSNGTMLWQKQYGGNLNDIGKAFISTHDGGYLLGGYSLSAKGYEVSDASKGQEDIWIVKTDGNGSKLWDRKFGGTADDRLFDMHQKTNGNFLLFGQSQSGANGNKSTTNLGAWDYWMVEIDANGNKLSDKQFGGTSGDNGRKIIAAPDGSYLFAGYSYSGAGGDKSDASCGSADYWIVKTDANGNRNHYASDPDGDTLTWSISGGTDASQFSINSTTGDLTFIGADFENPSDANGDNDYEVILKVTDPGGLSASKPVVVSVTDLNEVPTLGNGQSSLSLSIPEGSGPVTIPATWDRTFGGSEEDKLANTIKTSDGGYLLAGTSESNASGEKSQNSRGGKDYWVVKLDALGNKIWDRTLGGSGEDRCNGAIEVAEKGYLVYGGSTSPADGDRSAKTNGNQDFWIIRIDANGNKIWDKAYGGDHYEYCTYALLSPDGGFLLGGTTSTWSGGDMSSVSRGGEDYWIVKIDANGSKQWDKRYGGSDADGLQIILSNSDGGYLLGGYSLSGISGDKTENSRGKADYWVVKTDANGSQIWDRAYGGSGDDWLKKLVATRNDGFLLFGSSDSNASVDKSENSGNYASFWVVRINSNGSKIWDRTLNSSGDAWSEDAIITSDGNFILLGRAWEQNNHGLSDYWVVKINDSGQTLWDKNLGGVWDDFGESVLQSNDGGYLFSGFTWSSSYKSENSQGSFDYWIVKTDSSGNRNHYASDPDGDTLAWSITGGADAVNFSINAATGELTFNSADFEDPQDADQNNTYEVIIRATDSSGLFNEQSIVIEVEDVYEPTRENHFVELNSTVALEMIWVEPGTFTMGSPTTELGRDEDEPEHNVTLTQGFYLGKYEVTQAQYEAVMAGNAEGLASNPVSPQFKDPYKPVVQLNYADVQVFLKHLNEKQKSVVANGWEFTLPTEAQWEYACRAATKTAYSWGDELSPEQANYNWDGYWDNGNDYRLRKVGNYASNRWGFFDMHGNVSEWIRGWYRTYSEGNITDPEYEDIDAEHYVRGGDWYDDKLRSANRGTYATGDGDKNPFVGFRLTLRKKEPYKVILTKAEGLSVSTSDSVGSAITQFESTDLGGVSFTYSLVEGDEGIHNQFFTIDESGVLRTAKEFDYEADQLRQKIRVRATDTLGNPVEAVLTVILVPGDSEGIVNLTVDPQTIRKIRGVSELRREAYFSICDAGSKLDQRVKSQERYDYLIKELGITPGRRLGVVEPLIRWDNAVREDIARPEYTDIEYLKQVLRDKGLPEEPGSQFVLDMGGRLDIAAHGHKSAFPEFMGKSFTDYSGEDDYYPTNIDAAAELSANALKWKYNDFDRPAYYEPVNEPHWSFWNQPLFQQWHTKTHQAVQAMGLNVAVGGPCLSVAYYYNSQYGAFDGLKSFIDGTNAELDFYSFHAYDFLRRGNGGFDGGDDPSNPGRITSGMPLESVLDLVSNYTTNQYGKEVDVVLSEHGAYGTVELAEELANKHFPGEGFEWEMKKRSIIDFNMVSGVIANTMVFMDHPHVVKKATPFILMDSMDWDPNYYATLYVPRNFTDKNDWVETKQIYFYKLMRDVSGERISVHSPDPDIQIQGFANRNKVYVLLNNLSNTTHNLSLSIPTPETKTARRFGRNVDFTPYFLEEDAGDLNALQIKGRESIVLVLGYEALKFDQEIDEIPHYGDSIRVPVEGTSEITVSVPDLKLIEYAELRVGVSKESGTGRAVNISLNGNELNVPYEDVAIRLDNGQDYATCKIIRVPANYVQNENKVEVSFPDEGQGAVGSVVLRVVYQRKYASNDFALSNNTIQENQPIGTIVGQFSASDPDGDILTYSLTEDSAKAVLQAGGVRFETDSDMNYSIHIRYFHQSIVNPKWYSDTDLTIWVPKDMFNADAVNPVGAIVEAVNAQNSVLSASGTGPLGISYPGKIFYLEGNSPTDRDNDLFTLDENGTLRTSTIFDYESNASSFSISVEVRDEFNENMQKPFSITLGNINAPLVQSKDYQEISESTFKILGKVLNDGGAELSELGIETSENLSFSEARKTFAYPTPLTNEFSVNINSLDAEEKYYYRAYAINSEGIGYGSIRVLNTHNFENFWWKNLTAQAGGWRASEWFGIFRPYEHNWVFHAKMGWCNVHPDGAGGFWLWLDSHGWLWTKEAVWPYMYSHSKSRWLYLLGNRNGSPLFFVWELNAILPSTSIDLPGKKGVGFLLRRVSKTGNDTPEINFPKIKSLNPSWNHSWGSELWPQQPGEIEFIPMTWGGGRSLSDFKKYINEEIRPNVENGRIKRLFGFNEPNNPNQANMSVSEALERWPILESLGIPLCSPSPGGEKAQSWMEEFMHEVEIRGLRLDYVGVHWYGGVSFEGFKSKMESYYNKFGKRPLIITEFASADWDADERGFNRRTPEKVLAFMKEALPWLESTEWIYGYAWFPFSIDRLAGTSSALFDAQDNLTALGKFYQSVTPQNPSGDQSIEIE